MRGGARMPVSGKGCQSTALHHWAWLNIYWGFWFKKYILGLREGGICMGHGLSAGERLVYNNCSSERRLDHDWRARA